MKHSGRSQNELLDLFWGCHSFESYSRYMREIFTQKDDDHDCIEIWNSLWHQNEKSEYLPILADRLFLPHIQLSSFLDFFMTTLAIWNSENLLLLNDMESGDRYGNSCVLWRLTNSQHQLMQRNQAEECGKDGSEKRFESFSAFVLQSRWLRNVEMWSHSTLCARLFVWGKSRLSPLNSLCLSSEAHFRSSSLFLSLVLHRSDSICRAVMFGGQCEAKNGQEYKNKE